MDLDEIQQKLYEKLKPSGWADKLKVFLLSSDFKQILEQLLSEARKGKRFTPPLKHVFRAFEECPYNDLKVIIQGQDPYPRQDVADGIAFSCSLRGEPEASLKYVFKELETTVYKNGYTWDPDLKRWSNQGILMLNTALTTEIGQVGSHYHIWQPFLAYLYDILTFTNSGLVYVFLGKKAKEWASSVPDNNFKFFASHPASAAHNHADKWDSEDLFNKVSQTVKKQFGQDIVW